MSVETHNDLKAELAYLAHEISNKLCIVMSYATLLEKGMARGSQQANDIGEIVKATEQALEKLKDLRRLGSEEPPEKGQEIK